MIYHKYEIDERSTVINELYEDELITYCGDCQKELNVGIEDIIHIHDEGGDFVGTIFFCNECSQKKEDSL